MLLVCLTACADLTAPPAYPGTYQLAQVDGAPIPRTVVASRCSTTVHGAQLSLAVDAFMISVHVLAQCTTTMDGDTGITWSQGVFQLAGSVAQDGNDLVLVQQAEPGPAVLRAALHLRARPSGEHLELTWLDDLYGLPPGTRLTLVRTQPQP